MYVCIYVFVWRGRRNTNGVRATFSAFSLFFFFLLSFLFERTHYPLSPLPPLSRQIPILLFFSLIHRKTRQDKTKQEDFIVSTPRQKFFLSLSLSKKASVCFVCLGACALARLCYISSFTSRTVIRWGTPQIRHATVLPSSVSCIILWAGCQTLTSLPPSLSIS